MYPRFTDITPPTLDQIESNHRNRMPHSCSAYTMLDLQIIHTVEDRARMVFMDARFAQCAHVVTRVSMRGNFSSEKNTEHQFDLLLERARRTLPWRRSRPTRSTGSGREEHPGAGVRLAPGLSEHHILEEQLFTRS